MNELRPCEHASYLHHCIGGAQDGACIPSMHCYETLEINGTRYVRRGPPVKCESPPGLEVLNCTDDYAEPVFFRVEMVLEATP